MGILDRYTTDEDKEELAKNLNILSDEAVLSKKGIKHKTADAAKTLGQRKNQPI
jgi:hypothetical protein